MLNNRYFVTRIPTIEFKLKLKKRILNPFISKLRAASYVQNLLKVPLHRYVTAFNFMTICRNKALLRQLNKHIKQVFPVKKYISFKTLHYGDP